MKGKRAQERKKGRMGSNKSGREKGGKLRLRSRMGKKNGGGEKQG